jgi:hypothetical protein
MNEHSGLTGDEPGLAGPGFGSSTPSASTLALLAERVMRARRRHSAPSPGPSSPPLHPFGVMRLWALGGDHLVVPLA